MVRHKSLTCVRFLTCEPIALTNTVNKYFGSSQDAQLRALVIKPEPTGQLDRLVREALTLDSEALQISRRYAHNTRPTSRAMFNILDSGTLRIAKLLCWRYQSNHKRLYACLTYGALSRCTRFSDSCLDSSTFFCSLYATLFLDSQTATLTR